MIEEEKTEKASPVAKEKTKEKKEVIEERVYTIPFRHAWIAPIKNRSPRVIMILKSFMKKQMKTDNLVISREVNDYIWKKGIKGAPRKIRIRAIRNKDGITTVYLAKGG